MNNTFSFSRFGRYFKYDFKRWASSCGVPLLITSLMPIIAYAVIVTYGLVFRGEWCAPGLTTRSLIACLIPVVIIITYPAAMYGFVTDKRSGSMFLMIPVSLTEKFVSMVINAVILLPLLSSAVYFLSDALICLVDKNCGGALIASASSIVETVFRGAWTKEAPIYVSLFSVCVHFASCLMFFLLGAVLFKKHKKFFPILILIGIQMLLSLFVGFCITWGQTHREFMISLGNKFVDHSDFFINSLSAINAVMYCWDVLVLVALGAAVFFRLKSLKH